MTHPLFTAIDRKDPTEFRHLLEQELARPDGLAEVQRLRDGGHSLSTLAAEGGRLDMLRLLAAGGASLAAPGPEQLSPLHHAAARGDERMVEFLLKSKDLGVDPDSPDALGATAVHAAAEGGHVKVLAQLERAGASMDLPTKSGDTAAHYAARGDHWEVVDLLVYCASGSLVAQNRGGATPAHEAAAAGAGRVIERLGIRRGSQALTLPDCNGNLPQHIAAVEGGERGASALRALGRAGVDLKAATLDRVNCLQVATQNKDQPVLDVLREFGIAPPPVAPVTPGWRDIVGEPAPDASGERGKGLPRKPAQPLQP